MQYDFGDGPVIDGLKTVLFVVWLAWCRFRVVIPLRDRTAPSAVAALDRTFRILGGAPTYVLTDNEKTVTVSHIAGVPVRNQQTVDFARHYGVTVLTCQPADPASKGGVESSVKVAKADIVPKDTNLRAEYASFAELEAACDAFMDHVNGREHRATRRKPQVMLEEEQPRLHRVPDSAHTVAFGLSRSVPGNTPMVAFENGQYSVPSYLLGARVFVRSRGVGPDEQVIVVHVGPDGPVEVARHGRARPGSPKIDDSHFPEHRAKVPGDYMIKARSAAEAEFLGIGAGAHAWLLEWIGRKENVVVCGPSGTGKTFFLEALGQQAVEEGLRVAWFRLEDLGALVRAHRSDDSVSRVVARILRADLVVVDDIGLLEVGADAAEGLYRLVDAAYEKRSIGVSSNLHPAGFDELMPKTLATAIVDRLLHHAHVCQTAGESIRLIQALAGNGVTAMN